MIFSNKKNVPISNYYIIGKTRIGKKICFFVFFKTFNKIKKMFTYKDTFIALKKRLTKSFNYWLRSKFPMYCTHQCSQLRRFFESDVYRPRNNRFRRWPNSEPINSDADRTTPKHPIFEKFVGCRNCRYSSKLSVEFKLIAIQCRRRTQKIILLL